LQVFEYLETRYKIIPNISLFLTVWRICKEHERTDKTLGYMDYLFRYLLVSCARVRVRKRFAPC
jgi:hypothetical protein